MRPGRARGAGRRPPGGRHRHPRLPRTCAGYRPRSHGAATGGSLRDAGGPNDRGDRGALDSPCAAAAGAAPLVGYRGRRDVATLRRATGAMSLWLSRHPRRPGSLPVLAPWLGLYVGAGLLAIALSYAATHATGNLHFHLFWLGMLLFYIPVCLRLCQATVAYGERLALVVAIGIFDALPKYLLSPDH